MRQIFDTLPEFTQPASDGSSRTILFDFQMAEAEAMGRALDAATPDTIVGQLDDSYDRDAVNAALAQIDDASRALQARTKP